MKSIYNGTTRNALTIPIKVKGNELFIVLAVTVLESLVMTALVKNYGVEISGETTENGFKGSVKLQPGTKVESIEKQTI